MISPARNQGEGAVRVETPAVSAFSTSDLPDRLRSKINVQDDGCWIWTATTGPGGYGQTSLAGINRYSHRFVYELLVGLIPEGLQIDHLCRVRACCNPAHLEPVTCQENLRRGMGGTGINARKTHCIHGHEFTPQNTYNPPKRQHVRYCLKCRLERGRQRTRNRRAGCGLTNSAAGAAALGMEGRGFGIDEGVVTTPALSNTYLEGQTNG